MQVEDLITPDRLNFSLQNTDEFPKIVTLSGKKVMLVPDVFIDGSICNDLKRMDYWITAIYISSKITIPPAKIALNYVFV